MPTAPSQRAAELRREITRHDRLYYVEAQPEITNLEYDRLLEELKQLEAEHPELRTADSPTQRIGDAPVEHLAQVPHRVPMLSIENTYSREDLKAFFDRTEKLLEGEPVEWVMEYKIDGVAASIRYESGVMVLGLTRGNGQVGDDISHNVRTIRDLPLRLATDAPPAVLEVRGEVYMTNDDLADLNVRRTEAGAEPFKNTRNVTAGTIRLLDPQIAAGRNLRFFCHGVGETEGLPVSDHMQFLQWVSSLGIASTPDVVRLKSSAEALRAVERLETEMPDLPFEVDGIVFKVNNFAQRQRLGVRSKSPRWLIAYKFERYEAITRLESISVRVGKTGAVTPVAHLIPVDIAETTVSRASLHNADEIERLDVREGDTVVVEKAGKIIPKIVRVEKHRRQGDPPKFIYPVACPQCGTELERDPGGVYIRCPNPNCPAQLRQRLIYFGSRAGMDIDRLGEEFVDLLLERNLVHSYGDLYRLTADAVAELTWLKQRPGKNGQMIDVKVGRKNAEKLIESIDQSRSRGLDRLLASLSIRHVGPRVAQLITGRYPTLEQLRGASEENLAAIHEIGAVIATHLYEFLHSPYGGQTLDDLQAAGVQMHVEATAPAPAAEATAELPLAGKKIVVTGTLKNFTRDELHATIERLGGRATSSVSKSTDWVVAGEKAGSKLAKAEQLGVEVLNEEQFEQRIGPVRRA